MQKNAKKLNWMLLAISAAFISGCMFRSSSAPINTSSALLPPVGAVGLQDFRAIPGILSQITEVSETTNSLRIFYNNNFGQFPPDFRLERLSNSYFTVLASYVSGFCRESTSAAEQGNLYPDIIFTNNPDTLTSEQIDTVITTLIQRAHFRDAPTVEQKDTFQDLVMELKNDVRPLNNQEKMRNIFTGLCTAVILTSGFYFK